MKKRTGLTRIDSVVAVACVVFVLANVPVIIAGGRSRAKQEVCMANLRALTAAWTIYAEDNAGKLVNGAPQFENAPCTNLGCPTGVDYGCAARAPSTGYFMYSHRDELPWIGGAYNYSNIYVPKPECCQKCAISSGALWKYVQDYGIYRCPAGEKGFLITYSIVDSMNGLPRDGTYTGSSYPFTPVGSLWVKNINYIKDLSRRTVFIDEDLLTPDSFAVNYQVETWFDVPSVRHNNGANVSFVDGHAEHWKWKSQYTIDAGINHMFVLDPGIDNPPDPAAHQDLYKMQIGCWGQLGYTPTYTPDPNW